jgi:hypothetical protein
MGDAAHKRECHELRSTLAALDIGHDRATRRDQSAASADARP